MHTRMCGALFDVEPEAGIDFHARLLWLERYQDRPSEVYYPASEPSNQRGSDECDLACMHSSATMDANIAATDTTSPGSFSKVCPSTATCAGSANSKGVSPSGIRMQVDVGSLLQRPL